jgi:hypothetical protein
VRVPTRATCISDTAYEHDELRIGCKFQKRLRHHLLHAAVSGASIACVLFLGFCEQLFDLSASNRSQKYQRSRGHPPGRQVTL